MKTCVFITGTNAVGKSSLAWAIISRFGGVDRIANDVTYCRNGSVSLAGKYKNPPYGGVDSLNCTSKLASVVEEALEHTDTVFCEGCMMDTFGLNLTDAMFKAQRHLVVSLFLPPPILYKRLINRSLRMNGKQKIELIFDKQRRAMVAARKWQQIGVRVLQMDTSEYTIGEELAKVLETLEM